MQVDMPALYVRMLLFFFSVGFREVCTVGAPRVLNIARQYRTLGGPYPDSQVLALADGPDIRKRPLFLTRLLLEIPFLRECRGFPENAIKYFKITTSMAGRVDFLLNGMFNISRPAKELSEIKLILTKCKEQVSVNTCEHFQTWRFNKNVCQIFNGNKIWTKFNDNVSPKLTCPPTPGPYRIQNATFDMNVIQALPMPLEGHVYRVRHFMMEPHGVLHACSEMEIQFHRARN